MLSSLNTTASPPASPPTAGTLHKRAPTHKDDLHREHCTGDSSNVCYEGRTSVEQSAKQKTEGSESSQGSVMVVRTEEEEEYDDEGAERRGDAVIDVERIDHSDADSGRGQEVEYDDRSPACDTGVDTSMEVDNSPRDASRSRDTTCSDTLFVSGLHRDVRSADLEDKFSKIGEVEECRIVINPVSKESRGFAFLRYKDPAIAEKAVTELNKILIMGKVMTVERAKRSEPHRKTPGQYKGPVGASVKYDKEGRLRPGFVPFWDLPPPKDGTAIFDTSDIKVEQDSFPPLRPCSSDYSPHRHGSGHYNRRPVSDHPHHRTRGSRHTEDRRYAYDEDGSDEQHHRHRRAHDTRYDDEYVYRNQYPRRYTHDRRYRGESPVRPSSHYGGGYGRYDNRNMNGDIRSPRGRSSACRRRAAAVQSSEDTYAASSMRDTSDGHYTTRPRVEPYVGTSRTTGRHTHPYSYQPDLRHHHSQRDVQDSHGRRPIYDKSGMSDDDFVPVYTNRRAEYSRDASPVRRRSRSPYRAASGGTYHVDAKANTRQHDHRPNSARSPPPAARRGTTLHYADCRDTNSNVMKGRASLSPEVHRGARTHRGRPRYDAHSSDVESRLESSAESRGSRDEQHVDHHKGVHNAAGRRDTAVENSIREGTVRRGEPQRRR